MNIDVVKELKSLLPYLHGSTQGAAVEFAIKVFEQSIPALHNEITGLRETVREMEKQQSTKVQQ